MLGHIKRIAAVLSLAALYLVPLPARAEVSEIHIAQQYGLAYLPLMEMEANHLIEKQAAAVGLGKVTVKWTHFSGGSAMNDALLSGAIDFASGSASNLAILWEKTRSTLGIKAVAAMNSMPCLLNTNNPRIKSIRDFGATDKIALPAVKISPQALLLEIAAAKAFGDRKYTKLDPLTVSLGHPTAMQALLSGRSEVDAHFGGPPFQELELKYPGIHTVLSSYDILGGKNTFGVVWSTSRFRNANPKTFKAFVNALTDAIAIINRDKHAAAAFYVRQTHGKEPVDTIYRIIASPEVEYTMTPRQMMKYVRYLHQFGQLKSEPSSWKDLFFPEIHQLNGS
jgi:NitT/TauT family transport system substrate-binding protein